jgi:hypothetical protein
VLVYLSRYSYQGVIANSRLLTLDERGVTFKWKDYCNRGQYRFKAMTLRNDEHIRRFLIQVLSSSFHRIRGKSRTGSFKSNLIYNQEKTSVSFLGMRFSLLVEQGSTSWHLWERLS